MVVTPDDWVAVRESFEETQEQFAQRLGVSRALVSMLEIGKRQPHELLLRQLAAVLRTKGTGSTARAAILRRVQEGE